MDLHLHGKTALVTGSSAGIGFASAVALAREGASVVLNGRNADRLVDAEQRLLSLVPRASVRTSAADVATAQGADDLIEAVPDADILVDNTAALGSQPFTEIPDAEWTRFFETNVMSGVRLSRHDIPGMLTRGSEVTVNTVLPGPTATEAVNTMFDGVAGQTGASRDQIVGHFFAGDRAGSPLQRLATPDEVANLIAYLASPLASVTNGAVVRAEGGTPASIL